MTDHHERETDIELVMRSQRGDTEAFGTLYERYLNEIYRYIYYRVGSGNDAEDITETVFIQAWEALTAVPLEGFKFKPWIYRIAHNKVIDQYRTSHPVTSIEEQDAKPDDDADPEVSYQINEETKGLAKAISTLEPNLQDVLIYRFILGYSHEVTAEIMSLSAVHVRVLQHRAIGKLREWYQGEQVQND